MIGGFDDFQIVLDDDHRVPGVDQAVQNLQELADIVEMEARRGLVENVERSSRGPLGQFAGELDPLGLPAGEGGRLLAQFDVPHAHVFQGLQLAPDLGDRLRKI